MTATTTDLIEVKLTWAMAFNLCYDDPQALLENGLTLVKTGATGITLAAPRSVWEVELRFADAWVSAGAQWVAGNSMSARGVEGRIIKALNAHLAVKRGGG